MGALTFFAALFFGGIIYLIIGRIIAEYEASFPDADGFDYFFVTVGWLFIYVFFPFIFIPLIVVLVFLYRYVIEKPALFIVWLFKRH